MTTKTDIIRVTYGLTVNLGNFESVRVDASVERQLKPGESSEEAYTIAWKEVILQCKRQARRARKQLMKGDL